MNYNGIYEECVMLSQQGNVISIKKLMKIYLLADNRQNEKTARTALKKCKNKKVVVHIIEELLENSKESPYKLLLLGLDIDRCCFLYRYLKFCYDSETNIKQERLVKGIMSKALSAQEKEQIKKYIIDNNDYNKWLISLLDIEQIQPILESGLDDILNTGITDDLLQLLSLDYDYLDVVQDEIYNAIVYGPESNQILIRYLQISIEKNQELINNYKNIFYIYSILKNSKCEIENICFEYIYIKIALSIRDKIELKEKEWKIVESAVLAEEDKLVDIDNDKIFLPLLLALQYKYRDFVEKVLIKLYKKTKLYSSKALLELGNIRSDFAYREMLSFMLTSENRKERYNYAVKLLMKYSNKANAILEYAKELNDENLLNTLDEVANKFRISTNKTVNELTKNCLGAHIIEHGTIISELLYTLSKKINATFFYSAVGFAFSSGLKMLSPVFDIIYENKGKIQLIIGALQNYDCEDKNKKMDRKSAQFLNCLIEKVNIDIYRYKDAFYHGKFYYIGNEEKSYVIVGSSNISKTAFLGNYELDMLFEFEKNSEEEEKFLNWYMNLCSECDLISKLDIDQFNELDWNSELDVYNYRNIRKVSYTEMASKITGVTDEEIKNRLNLWMSYLPTDIYSNLEIEALSEYIVFLYAEKGIAVFESFISGNAYYTFRYYDFEQLLSQVASLSKTQMMVSSDFMTRGYHIHNKENIANKIAMLFNETD